MKNKIFLGLQGIMFVFYGLYCLADPGMLADSAGLSATTMTGTIELQAMYGGLQTAVGVLCVLAVIQLRLQVPALTALLFIFSGLAVVRVSLGLTHSEFSDYNVFAMSYESVSLVLTLWLLKATNRMNDGGFDAHNA